ncbi:unnamed protein product, partial [Arabidopsis halleri]
PKETSPRYSPRWREDQLRRSAARRPQRFSREEQFLRRQKSLHDDRNSESRHHHSEWRRRRSSPQKTRSFQDTTSGANREIRFSHREASPHGPEILNTPPPSNKTNGQPSTLSGRLGSQSSPRSRRPALERLSGRETALDQNQGQGISSSMSGRLQDVNIQYLGEEGQAGLTNNNNNLLVGDCSDPIHPTLGHRLSLGQESSQAELRRPASLRLEQEQPEVTITIPAKIPKPRANPKRKGTAVASGKGSRSPLQGACSRKRNSTNQKGVSAKKRLCQDQIQSDLDPATEIQGAQPPVILIPAAKKAKAKVKAKGVFRFDRSLREKEEIHTLVSDSWKSGEEETLFSKFGRCRRRLIQWAKEQLEEKLGVIKRLQEALEAELSSPNPNNEEISMLSGKLKVAYQEEEAVWRQRSRIQWLKEGDQNTSFFHAVTRGRRALNHLSVIEDEEGSEHFEEKKIAETVARFYENLFKSSSISQLSIVEEAIQPQISAAMNSKLIIIPLEKEIHEAEPWLSISEPVCPVGPPPLSGLNLRVKDLLHPNSTSWNLEAIRSFVPQHEEEILKIILSAKPKPDRLRWLPLKSGSYTSKSGYLMGKSVISLTQVESFKWTTHVWKVCTSPKLRMFLWKAARDALPVGKALACRGVTAAAVCKRCGEEEDPLHVFFLCSLARKVWDLAPVLGLPDLLTVNSLQDWLAQAKKLIILPPIGLCFAPLFPWLLWFIWKARNLLIFEDRSCSEFDTVQKAILEAKSWQAAKLLQAQKKVHHKGREKGAVHKEAAVCFSDASWRSPSMACGLGWIVKNNVEADTLAKAALSSCNFSPVSGV